MTVAALMVDRAANSNKIHNIHVSSAKIGFLVGAAPSQETCYGGARAWCKTPMIVTERNASNARTTMIKSLFPL